jgi:hypothetical protein
MAALKLQNVNYGEDLSFVFDQLSVVKREQLHSTGLGRSPDYINSTSSLLLFYMNETPSRDAIGLGNFEGNSVEVQRKLFDKQFLMSERVSSPSDHTLTTFQRLIFQATSQGCRALLTLRSLSKQRSKLHHPCSIQVAAANLRCQPRSLPSTDLRRRVLHRLLLHH